VKGSMLFTRCSAAVVAVVAGYVSYMHIVDVALIWSLRPGMAVDLGVRVVDMSVAGAVEVLVGGVGLLLAGCSSLDHVGRGDRRG